MCSKGQSLKSNIAREELFSPVKQGYLYRNEYNTHVNFSCLGKMYCDKLLCDVVLATEGMEIQVHKVILATCSPLFYFKFSDDRKLNLLNRIEMDNITYETLSTVIKFFYTAEVFITEHNVADLLDAAYYLAVQELKDVCWDFLEANLKPENCLRAAQIAQGYHHDNLIATIEEYVDEHISEVLKCDEYLDLSFDRILDLLSRFMECTDEEEKLDCIIRWIRFDSHGRKDHIYSLVEYVQLSLISPKHMIERIGEETWLKNDPQFMLEYIKSQDVETSVTSSAQLRPPSNSQLLVAVGFTSDWYLSLEVYDFCKSVWTEGPEVLKIKCRTDSRVALYGTKIYCFDSETIKSIDISSDPAQMTWTDYTGMLGNREYFSVATLENNIYVVGGFEDGNPVTTVEIFDVTTLKWKRVENLSVFRCLEGLGVVDGTLLAVGGITKDIVYTSEVECYKPSTNSWYTVPPMPVKRCNPGVGSLGKILVVAGGRNNSGSLKEVESFNPAQLWNRLPSMNVGRDAPGVIGLNGQVWVIGGDSGRSVEIYDSKSNTWLLLPNLMNTMKKYVKAALLKKSNIQF